MAGTSDRPSIIICRIIRQFFRRGGDNTASILLPFKVSIDEEILYILLFVSRICMEKGYLVTSGDL